MRASLLLILFFTIAATSEAQEEPLRPGRLPSELRLALKPGLQVTFFPTGAEEAADERVSRFAALFVEQDEPLTPFLEPGPFRAEWNGYLKAKLRGSFRFSLVGSGEAELWLNETQVLEAAGDLASSAPVEVELNKGHNAIRLVYRSPEEGEARIRLYWQGEDFYREQVPANVLEHDGRNPALAVADGHRQARELLATRNCFRCHRAPVEAGGHAPMPELASRAPDLVRASARFKPNWLAHWLLTPDELRTKTTMPRLLSNLAEEEAEKAAVDIAVYLTSLSAPPEQEAGEPEEAVVEAGLALYEDRGCIACHRLTAPGEEDGYNRVSLHYLGEKFHGAALLEFLQKPHEHYPWSRMPQFGLSAEEAGALAAFLLSRAEGKLEPLSAAGDAGRGREHFQSLGCVQCHDTGEPLRVLPGDTFPQLFAARERGRGCLAEEPAGAPDYQFEETEREALKAFLSAGREISLTRTVPMEFAERQVRLLNCRACHPRDDDFGTLPYVIQEEGEQGIPADRVPSLTWVGGKLHTAWMEEMLAGKLPYRVRDYFRTRMPAFPERAELLALGLAHQAGFSAEEDTRPEFNAKLAATGAEIGAMDSGLSCARCHAVGKQPALAPFEAQAPNLVLASPRLRYEYYERWMFDPLRVEPDTKMIKFAADGKLTGLTQFYEGDAAKQFESLWHHLIDLSEKHPIAEVVGQQAEKLEPK